jgi:hypothetical protein
MRRLGVAFSVCCCGRPKSKGVDYFTKSLVSQCLCKFEFARVTDLEVWRAVVAGEYGFCVTTRDPSSVFRIFESREGEKLKVSSGIYVCLPQLNPATS